MALNISVKSGIVNVYRTTSDTYDKPSFASYPASDLRKFFFTLGIFELQIGADVYQCLFTDLRVGGATPYDFDAANTLLSAVFNPCCSSTGASGSFLTTGTHTVTVVNGIITAITGSV